MVLEKGCLTIANIHSCAVSPLSAHSDIGLSPISDPSDIRLKGNQSDIISDIGLTFLAISGILIWIVLVMRYRISAI